MNSIVHCILHNAIVKFISCNYDRPYASVICYYVSKLHLFYLYIISAVFLDVLSLNAIVTPQNRHRYEYECSCPVRIQAYKCGQSVLSWMQCAHQKSLRL